MAKKKSKTPDEITETAPVETAPVETAPVETAPATPMAEDRKPHKSPWPYIALAVAIPALAIGGLALYEQRNTARTIADIETRVADAVTGGVTAADLAASLADTEQRIMDEITRIEAAMENLPAPVNLDTKPLEARLAVIESRLAELATATETETPQPDEATTTAAATEESSSWSWRRFFGDALKITPVGDGPVESDQ